MGEEHEVTFQIAEPYRRAIGAHSSELGTLEKEENGPTCGFCVIADPPVAVPNAELVLMCPWSNVERF